MPFTDYRAIFLFAIPILLNGIFLYRCYSPSFHRGRAWFYRDDATNFNWWEAIISFVVFIGLWAGLWYWGRNLRINNYVEQIGGFIVNKYAVDGEHEESYETCSGEGEDRSCTKHYYTVYHREFFVETNIGDWFNDWQWSDTVDKDCETCEPDHIPQYYADSYVGKPVSLDNTYPNYIAAMNEAIYRNTYNGLASYLPDICPATPDIRVSPDSVIKAIPVGFQKDAPVRHQVYAWNFYSADPNFNPASYMMGSQPQANAIPLYMDTMFGYLGGAVQADVHLYVMNSPIREYADMCLAKWKMGAKNSIYIFIFGNSDGITYNPTGVYPVVAVDGTNKNSELVFENEGERSNYYMKYDLEKELMNYFNNGGTLDRENVLRIVFSNVSTKFVRQEMANYQGLKDYVYPSDGFMIFMAIALLILDLIVHWYFADNEY